MRPLTKHARRALLATLCLCAGAGAGLAVADEPPQEAPPTPPPTETAPPPPPAPTTPAPQAPQVSSPSRRVVSQDGHDNRLLLDGEWYHRLDRENRGIRSGFMRQASLAGWSTVRVPHAWNATDLSDASQRGTVGWYRKDFRAPSGGRGVSWRFRFESVNYRARVYLNGREIGRNEFGYLPFEVAARDLRRGTNRLVVRVDNRRSERDLPPARNQLNGRPGGGWWNYGGILREVYLRRVDRIDIRELLARPTLPCRRCPARVLVRAVLANPGGGKRRVRLSATVGSRRVRFPAVEVPSGGTRTVQQTIRIDNPSLWEPGHPSLYRVKAIARVGRSIAASYTTHIGIRSIVVDRRGRMLLNGRPVKLRGASVHEDHPQVGAAWTERERIADFTLLKELGATMTRAHYPLHPQFLELADRSGILVWDQIPFYQVRNESLRSRAVRDKGLRYLDRTIRRDQNHASVFTWSVGNELPSRVTTGQRAYLEGASRLARALDPTRLVAIDFAGYPSAEQQPAYRVFDAIGINSYFGWYPGPNGQIVDRDLLGPYLEQLHDYYPRQGIFITEFGAEANRSGPIDEKGTFEFQREFMQFHVSTYDASPVVNGAVAWILRDFRVRPDWDGGNPKPTPPVNFKGLVSETGERKPAFFDVARLYRNTRAVSGRSR